jgi:threonine/homoserine/homoserine lactone efflux protein
MDVTYLLRGLVIGFAIAAPVGPIGVLCIRRSFAQGRVAGLVSGLGAATADAIYGFVAAFGLTFVSGILIGQQQWIRLIGGLFLCYLGIRTFIAKPAAEPSSAEGTGLAGAYVSTFFLTLTNPMTILSFAAVFAGLGIGSAAGNYLSAALLVLGVFLGSGLWWLLLSGGVSLLRTRLKPRALRWVNTISGIIILGFGVTAILTLTRR